MGSAPDTTLGPHVFGANYFSNNTKMETLSKNKLRAVRILESPTAGKGPRYI
jgi:hypothetical protein